MKKIENLMNNTFAGNMFEGFSDTSNRGYLFVCDIENDASRWSKRAVEDFDLPSEYMIDAAKIWGSRIFADDKKRYEDEMEAVFSKKKEEFSLTYRVLNSAGEYVMCTGHGKIVEDPYEGMDLFIGTIENHSLTDNVDANTSLYNIYVLQEELTLLKNSGSSYIELLLRIDNMYEINDIYGFDIGDDVLRSVAMLLRSMTKDMKKLYKVEGSRFACIFEDWTEEELKDFYYKLKDYLKNEFEVNGIRIAAFISGGAVHVEDGEYEVSVIQNAVRSALEKSRRDRRGGLVCCSSKLGFENQKIVEIVSMLRQSISDGCKGFHLCYQPLVSVKDETIIGAEALLRWKHEKLGEVMPGVFIPWLENDPTFFDVGNWIMKQAMTEMKPMLKLYPDFTLNINLAYTQLIDNSFRDAVRGILEETGFPARNLCMELTERCRLIHESELVSQIKYLKSLGIHIALDDFGTGYSSLNLLTDLPLDVVKFDRDFTKDLDTNVINQTLIKAISESASQMGMHICLEGIETREMVDYSKALNIDCSQGYYYSKPIPRDAFIKYCIDYEYEKLDSDITK